MQKTIQSEPEVQGKSLRGVVDVEDEEEFQVLGFCEWATTGEVLVPRQWLQKKWEYYNLPESFFPSEVWPSSSFKRAMQYISDNFESKYINGHEAKFRMESGDGYIRHVYLDTFFPQEEIGVSGGEWRQQKLGHFDYDGTNQTLKFHTEAEGEVVEEEWNKLVGRAQGAYQKMQKSHNGVDLNGVLLDFVKQDSTAIPLRNAGSIYFFPAQYQDILENLSKLWGELNQFKESGARTQIVTLPVVDSGNHRQLVRRQAEELINDQVEKIIESSLDRLSESGEETAEEIAENVIEEMSDTIEIANEYSSLLEVELSVKRELDKHLRSLEGEKENLVEEIAEQVEV